MMETKYDLTPEQTPYPYTWFETDIRLGCLSIHLDDDKWHKCVVSEMQTNIQLMISMHLMDQGSTINYDIEEKEINLGANLIFKELAGLQEEFVGCEMESLKDLLGDSFSDFKMLYSSHMNEINLNITNIKAQNALAIEKTGSATSHRAVNEGDEGGMNNETTSK